MPELEFAIEVFKRRVFSIPRANPGRFLLILTHQLLWYGTVEVKKSSAVFCSEFLTTDLAVDSLRVMPFVAAFVALPGIHPDFHFSL